MQTASREGLLKALEEDDGATVREIIAKRDVDLNATIKVS